MLKFRFLKPVIKTIILLLITNSVTAQQIAHPGGNLINFFNSSPFGGQLGHTQSGSFGNFGTGDRWIGIGQPAGVSQQLYGFRIQDRRQAATFSLNQNRAGNLDLETQWGPDENSKYRLNFITSLFGGDRNVMTAASTGQVGFNNDNPENTSAQVSVISNSEDLAFSCVNNSGVGLFSSGTTYGSQSVVNDNISSLGIGAYNRAVGLSGFRYGNYSYASTSNGPNIATYGYSTSQSGYNNGVRGFAVGEGSSFTAGVYGGISGIGPNDFAGYFAGNVQITGSLLIGSDRRLKENIKDEANVLDRLMKVRPATYLYKQEGKFAEMNLADGQQHGFIAQELEEVFPEMVKQSAFVFGMNGTPEEIEKAEQEQMEFKTVTYQAMIPVLTKGIQEQQVLIQNQEDRMEDQENLLSEQNVLIREQKDQIQDLTIRLEQLEAKLGTAITKTGSPSGASISDNLETGNVLYQNTPNPFSETTTIKFELAEGTGNAELILFDMTGKEIRKFSNLKSGAQAIELQGRQLEAGMYLYSLIVNGAEIDTKRMILTKN